MKPQPNNAGGVEEGSQAQALRGPQRGSSAGVEAHSAQRLECDLASGPRAESARRCSGVIYLLLSPFSRLS